MNSVGARPNGVNLPQVLQEVGIAGSRNLAAWTRTDMRSRRLFIHAQFSQLSLHHNVVCFVSTSSLLSLDMGIFKDVKLDAPVSRMMKAATPKRRRRQGGKSTHPRVEGENGSTTPKKRNSSTTPKERRTQRPFGWCCLPLLILRVVGENHIDMKTRKNRSEKNEILKIEFKGKSCPNLLNFEFVLEKKIIL